MRGMFHSFNGEDISSIRAISKWKRPNAPSIPPLLWRKNVHSLYILEWSGRWTTEWNDHSLSSLSFLSLSLFHPSTRSQFRMNHSWDWTLFVQQNKPVLLWWIVIRSIKIAPGDGREGLSVRFRCEKKRAKVQQQLLSEKREEREGGRRREGRRSDASI